MRFFFFFFLHHPPQSIPLVQLWTGCVVALLFQQVTESGVFMLCVLIVWCHQRSGKRTWLQRWTLWLHSVTYQTVLLTVYPLSHLKDDSESIMTSLKEYLHLDQSRMQLLYCSWQSASATPTSNVEFNFSGLFLMLVWWGFLKSCKTLVCPLTRNFFTCLCSHVWESVCKSAHVAAKLPQITKDNSFKYDLASDANKACYSFQPKYAVSSGFSNCTRWGDKGRKEVWIAVGRIYWLLCVATETMHINSNSTATDFKLL